MQVSPFAAALDPTLFPHLAWLVAAQFAFYAVGWAFFSLILKGERAAVAHWSAVMVLMGLGFLLTASRDGAHEWLPYVGGGLAFVWGAAILRRGVSLFFRVDPVDRELFAVTAVASVLLVIAGPGAESTSMRALVIYSADAWLIARAVQLVVNAAIAEFGRLSLILAAASGVLTSIIFAARAVAQLLDWSRPLELQAATPMNEASLYAHLAAAAMFNFSFMALVTLRLVRRLRTLARQDPLTHLPNRRALEDDLQQEWQRFRAGAGGFAILALDLDHFKRVNDAHGHLAGDAVLEQFAVRVRASVRKHDIVARTGGEEFIVLMPDTSVDDARTMAQRLMDAVRARPFDLPGVTLPLTVSVGITHAQPQDDAVLRVLKRADEALYRAKSEGRDRLALAFA